MKDADLLQAADDYNSFYLRQGIEALIAERDAALAMCAKLDDQAKRAVQCAEGLSAEAAGRRAAQPGLTYCAERAKPGGWALPNVQCGWPACNAPPEAPRAPYEIPR